MTTTMVEPKIFEPYRDGNVNRGEGGDCFDLVKMFGARVLRLAKFITENDADAEDVVVETFLKVCPDANQQRSGDRMPVNLATTAVQEALEKLRLRGTERDGDLCGDVVIREVFAWGDNYREHHSTEQTTDILEQAMWTLDPMCRAVFVLRDMEEIPLEQTARALNRSVAAVEVCHLRARLQLREQLATSFRPPLPAFDDIVLTGYGA